MSGTPCETQGTHREPCGSSPGAFRRVYAPPALASSSPASCSSLLFFFLDPTKNVASWEDEISDFYAHVGYNMGYSWAYCHSMLYAIRRVHRLNRINLYIREEAMPLLHMLRKGLK